VGEEENSKVERTDACRENRRTQTGVVVIPSVRIQTRSSAYLLEFQERGGGGTQSKKGLEGSTAASKPGNKGEKGSLDIPEKGVTGGLALLEGRTRSHFS